MGGVTCPLLSRPFKGPHLTSRFYPTERILFFSSAGFRNFMEHRLIWFPQMHCYSIHTKQIYARAVNGLKYNGDIAAKPAGINHISGLFIFVQ